MRQELLILALKEWTKAYGPLVLLLEDFDRADALSWALLSRCAEEIDMAVLVIVAVRPNDGAFATPLPGQVNYPMTPKNMCAQRLIGKQHATKANISDMHMSIAAK